MKGIIHILFIIDYKVSSNVQQECELNRTLCNTLFNCITIKAIHIISIKQFIACCLSTDLNRSKTMNSRASEGNLWFWSDLCW